MDIEKLKFLLKPWLRVDTWHTGHPMDDERYHRALHSAFEELDVNISTDDFRQAIALCLEESCPGDEKAFKGAIEEFAQRAEYISSYLYDLKPY
ncbi:hypothetical protein PMI35_01080 [Pseudomonas sp. GM78]|uniref:hypothetical protein n=1 Tax=Pseudomonas sp. GM78 TaxID=1144337 RepID=UPI00026F62DF|nr:hypothetical protein [Pseudomonas sp. GM78]EJN32546.1 hypothetical protein PMI35_01080 [Pseudomonas sp. GM78]